MFCFRHDLARRLHLPHHLGINDDPSAKLEFDISPSLPFEHKKALQGSLATYWITLNLVIDLGQARAVVLLMTELGLPELQDLATTLQDCLHDAISILVILQRHIGQLPYLLESVEAGYL